MRVAASKESAELHVMGLACRLAAVPNCALVEQVCKRYGLFLEQVEDDDYMAASDRDDEQHALDYKLSWARSSKACLGRRRSSPTNVPWINTTSLIQGQWCTIDI
eukprot:5382440-Amphidinium_carterae.1